MGWLIYIYFTILRYKIVLPLHCQRNVWCAHFYRSRGIWHFVSEVQNSRNCNSIEKPRSKAEIIEKCVEVTGYDHYSCQYTLERNGKWKIKPNHRWYVFFKESIQYNGAYSAHTSYHSKRTQLYEPTIIDHWHNYETRSFLHYRNSREAWPTLSELFLFPDKPPNRTRIPHFHSILSNMLYLTKLLLFNLEGNYY